MKRLAYLSARRVLVVGALVVVAAAAVAAVGVVAYAQADGDNVIHACYDNTNGSMRFYDPADVDGGPKPCKDNETTLEWNIEGVQGTPGVPGSARAYATVEDYPWVSEPYPILRLARSRNVESVTRADTGAYCLRLQPGVGDIASLAAVVSPIAGSADRVFATVAVGGCAYDPSIGQGQGIVVNLFDSSGANLNWSFHLVVP